MAKMTEAKYRQIAIRTRNRKDLTLKERKAIIDKAYEEMYKERIKLQERNAKKLQKLFSKKKK